MQIRLIEDSEGFGALRTEWNDLLTRSSADTIFLTWEWLYSWWECYAEPNDALHIVVVRDNTGELIGILPLYRRYEPWLPLKRIKVLRFIGDGSWDSDYLDAIFLQSREHEILAAVWQWLVSRRSSWSLARLSGVPAGSPTCLWLKGIVEDKQVVSRSESVPCLVADLPATWEEYLASLKPRFRTKVRSTLRDLATGYNLEFASLQNETDLQSGLETLYEIHGQRWELKGTEGVFRNPAKRRFYDRFSRLFLANGWLAFDFLRLNGTVAACQMCFRYNSTQFLLQEGFHPQFASDSVGIALRAMVFKKGIEEGVRRYDFLAGVGRHKTQWQTRAKECQIISLGPRTLQNTLYLKVPIALDALKERVKMAIPAKLLEMHRGANVG